MSKLALSSASLAAVAAACHAVNRAYCQSLGDDSQAEWADAPDWQRQSAENGVKFHLENPDAGDSASHDNWMAEKVAAGWKYGEVKDEKKKQHPCIVPFDQLPREQQAKDALFRSVVHSVAPALAQLEGGAAAEATNDMSTRLNGLVEGLSQRGFELPAEGEATAFALATIDDLAAKDVAGDTGAREAELEAENVKLKEELDAAKKAKSAAQKRASAAEGQLPAKPRKVGRMNFPDGNPSPAELRELLEGADTVEVVLSDGKNELGLPPRQIEGAEPWQDMPQGLKLNVGELLVHGPGVGSRQSSYVLAGYGLVVDGKQVAWSERPEQLTIGAGATFDLKDDVIF